MILYTLLAIIIVLALLILGSLQDSLKASHANNEALLQGFNELLQRLHPMNDKVSELAHEVQSFRLLTDLDPAKSIGTAIRDELGYWANPQKGGKSLRDQLDDLENVLKDIAFNSSGADDKLFEIEGSLSLIKLELELIKQTKEL